ncbi:putative fungal-specific transcription factor, partial [Coniochaeta ligniaria NRRL 30616]
MSAGATRMSGTSRTQRADCDGASIPPIEIGSLATPGPENKSDFIGSASGVFFVNTVFRAFAAAAAVPSNAEQTRHAEAAAAVAPDPGSAHSYLAADEGTHANTAGDDTLLQAETVRGEADTPDVLSYGVAARGLGSPPPAAMAKKLIMLYFRNWHPFFPFLHGPTFFQDVDHFYHRVQSSDADTTANASADLRRKLCRALTFQCIFNLAASGRDSVHLEAESRIQSASALTGLLGTVYGTHDISAVQALLAVELYLTCTMSLRAASVVHGALTRILYHSGFHRCPFRFVQLPPTMHDIRKRIFWCAYVLDRHLSQALGYPVAIRDDEVDVCIPGMGELHEPVKPREQTSPSQAVTGDHVREHLPRSRSSRAQGENETSLWPNGEPIAETGDTEAYSPEHHHMGSPEVAGEYVLGYLVTYSRLLGTSLDLFHKSIHKRVITRDKVLEITSRTHAWWNNLPRTLQGDFDGSATSSDPQFGLFFSMLYHYLDLLNNRPFLSLPPHTVDFRSSSQSALSASLAIIALGARRLEVSLLLAWPGTLSATWMGGLVVAYAGLLGLYPPEKAVADLDRCLALLHDMGSNWASARHCHGALSTLRHRLALRPGRMQAALSVAPISRVSSIDTQQGPLRPRPSQPSSHKRQRTNGNVRTHVPSSLRDHVGSHSCPIDVVDPSSGFQDWQTVLEYTGPEFGFDTEQFAGHGEWPAAAPAPILDPALGLSSNVGFEAYVQHFGDRLN